MEWRTASRDTALLFFSLLTPGPLPEYVRASHSATLDLAIERLTLDGILEVQNEGRFVSGEKLTPGVAEVRTPRCVHAHTIAIHCERPAPV